MGSVCFIKYFISNAGKFTTRGVILVDIGVVSVNAAVHNAMLLPVVDRDGHDEARRSAKGQSKGPVASAASASVACLRDVQYVTITVSNTRCGAGVPDPEAAFIPFRGTFSGNTTTATGTRCVLLPCMITQKDKRGERVAVLRVG